MGCLLMESGDIVICTQIDGQGFLTKDNAYIVKSIHKWNKTEQYYVFEESELKNRPFLTTLFVPLNEYKLKTLVDDLSDDELFSDEDNINCGKLHECLEPVMMLDYELAPSDLKMVIDEYRVSWGTSSIFTLGEIFRINQEDGADETVLVVIDEFCDENSLNMDKVYVKYFY